MRYDVNSFPVSARCPLCGEQMPQGIPRILNPVDNDAWFAAQEEANSPVAIRLRKGSQLPHIRTNHGSCGIPCTAARDSNEPHGLATHL